jgi:tripartite ATP-independent transporter DctM subunit
MSLEMIILIMFGSLLGLLAIGVPIAFALGGVSVGIVYFVQGPHALITMVYSTFALMWQILFVTVPLFIFMGAVLQRSGIAGGLYQAAHRWTGSMKGGLSIGTVLMGVFFAAMTGITGASTVTMGIIAIPAMLNRGYNKHLAIGCVAGAGSLAILIPPSIPMVLLALFTRQSVGKMLIGGIIPGILIASMFVTYIIINGILRPESCPPHPQKFSFKDKIISSKGIILPFGLISLVLGSMFFGLATPTEAAALGAAGTVICCYIQKMFSRRLIQEAIHDTFKLTGIVMWIGFGAACFSTTFTSIGGIDVISELIAGLELGRWTVFFVIALIILLLGSFLDPTSIIMIAGPITFSVLTPLGFDPIWLGIIFVILLECGYLTPPFGFNIFYLKSITPPEISISDIIGSIWPWLIILLIGILILAAMPQLVLWLPNAMMR